MAWIQPIIIQHSRWISPADPAHFTPFISLIPMKSCIKSIHKRIKGNNSWWKEDLLPNTSLEGWDRALLRHTFCSWMTCHSYFFVIPKTSHTKPVAWSSAVASIAQHISFFPSQQWDFILLFSFRFSCDVRYELLADI